MKIILLMVIFFSQTCVGADSALSLLKELKGRLSNPPKALMFVYEDEKNWNLFLANLSAGSKEWLDCAQKLWPVADAGAAEQMEISIGRLIVAKPTVGLRFVKKTWQGKEKDSMSAVAKVCGSVAEEVSGKNEAHFAISKLKKSLSTVTDSNLNPLKQQCSDSLEKLEQKLDAGQIE